MPDILSVKQLRNRYNTSTIMLSSALIATAILFVATFVTGETFLPGDWRGWLVLLGLAWFSHVGGQSLIAYALAFLPASFSSVMMLMQPVVAALFAWLLLSEAMTPLQAAGGAFVVLGVLLARRGSGRASMMSPIMEHRSKHAPCPPPAQGCVWLR